MVHWHLLIGFNLFQEWPEEDYPAYANGPGYILSSDIAEYIVSEFEKHKLRVGLKLFPFFSPTPSKDDVLMR